MTTNPQNPRGVVDLRIILTNKSPADVTGLLAAASTSPGLFRNQMAALVAGGADTGVGLVARARGVTIPSGASTFTCTAASATVGDKLILMTPGGPVTLTCVANATENPFLGQYSTGVGATDSTYATSIRLAINQYVPSKQLIAATGSTNSIVCTAIQGGTVGNTFKLVKQVTTAGTFSFTSGVAFTGGIDLDTAKTSLITVGTNPTANDTLRFGNVVLTWKASATNENEVTIGGDTTISATNLAAKIVAHSILGGILTESHSTNTVTISSSYPDLLAALLYLVSSAGTVTIANQLAPTGMTFTASSAVAATNGVF